MERRERVGRGMPPAAQGGAGLIEPARWRKRTASGQALAKAVSPPSAKLKRPREDTACYPAQVSDAVACPRQCAHAKWLLDVAFV